MSIMDGINSLIRKITGVGASSAPTLKVDKSVLLEKIRQTDLFKDVPEENLNEMYTNMEIIAVPAGKQIVTEGQEGDFYYLLAEGHARVTRNNEVLADLDEPQGFGEESLISNATRNATVTMTTDGAVMRLSKDGFNDYVKEPLLDWFSPSEAQKKIADGAKWIDVREEDKAKQDHLHGSLAIPVTVIRDRFEELEKDTLYICYCENGRLSSTAAFLMRQEGFKVGVLRGGLKSLKQAGIA